MNKQNYLFTKLSEECGELIQAVSKYKIFGPKSKFLEKDDTNELQLAKEYLDILAVVELLEINNIIDLDKIFQENNIDPDEYLEKKKDKIRYFGKVSQDLLYLEEEIL